VRRQAYRPAGLVKPEPKGKEEVHETELGTSRKLFTTPGGRNRQPGWRIGNIKGTKTKTLLSAERLFVRRVSGRTENEYSMKPSRRKSPKELWVIQSSRVIIGGALYLIEEISGDEMSGEFKKGVFKNATNVPKGGSLPLNLPYMEKRSRYGI